MSGTVVMLPRRQVVDTAPGHEESLQEDLRRRALWADTAVAAVLAFVLLLQRRFWRARVAAAAQVALIVTGQAASQYPYLVVPDVTLRSAAAGVATQRILLGALAVGGVLIVPSLVLLLRIFQAPEPKT